MLKMMAAENMEEYGHKFGVIIETVKATIDAALDGRIELGATGRDALDASAYVAARPGLQNSLTVSRNQIANFIGFGKTKAGDALLCLKLVRAGHATGAQFKPLSHTATAELARQIQGSIKEAEERAAEKEERAKEAEEKGRAAQARRIRKRAAEVKEYETRNAVATGKEAPAQVTKGKMGHTKIREAIGYRPKVERKSLPDPSGFARKVRDKLDRMVDDAFINKQMREVNQFREHCSNRDMNLMLHGFLKLAERATREAAKLQGYDAVPKKEPPPSRERLLARC